jgi:hypothetical protein
VHPPHQQLGIELLGAGVAEPVAGTPLGQAQDHGPEVQAGLGELVAVIGAADDLRRLQLAEAAGQQRPGDPGQAAGQLVEPPGAHEHVAHDQQGPSLAQHLDGTDGGAVLGIGAHASSVAPPVQKLN